MIDKITLKVAHKLARIAYCRYCKKYVVTGYYYEREVPRCKECYSIIDSVTAGKVSENFIKAMNETGGLRDF